MTGLAHSYAFYGREKGPQHMRYSFNVRKREVLAVDPVRGDELLQARLGGVHACGVNGSGAPFEHN